MKVSERLQTAKGRNQNLDYFDHPKSSLSFFLSESRIQLFGKHSRRHTQYPHFSMLTDLMLLLCSALRFHH